MRRKSSKTLCICLVFRAFLPKAATVRHISLFGSGAIRFLLDEPQEAAKGRGLTVEKQKKRRTIDTAL